MHEAMGLLHGGNFLKKRVGSGKGGAFRDLYGMFFKSFHILPDMIARQNPFILLNALDYQDEAEDEVPQSGYLAMFYGK